MSDSRFSGRRKAEREGGRERDGGKKKRKAEAGAIHMGKTRYWALTRCQALSTQYLLGSLQ